MANSVLRIETSISAPTGQTELTHVFKQPGTLAFEDKYHHYIHLGALRGLTGLTITGLNDAEIHFLAPLSGDIDFPGSYFDEAGVLNLVDCHNVVISGVFQNLRPYRSGELTDQTGNAVNVCRSTVKFVHSQIFSAARMPFAAHSGSLVEIEDSVIEGDYFELFNGASSVTVRRSRIIQDASYPDSHSMLWTGSSHLGVNGGNSYRDSNTIFDGCEFVMKSGRSLVSGNGSYDTKSNVEFRGCSISEKDQNFGICSWHENFNSIIVQTNGSFGEYRPTDLLEVAPGTSGFARFIDYYQDGGRPGGPSGESPIVVDGVSSSDIM